MVAALGLDDALDGTVVKWQFPVWKIRVWFQMKGNNDNKRSFLETLVE